MSTTNSSDGSVTKGMIMEPMEIGNLMYVEYEGRKYVGAEKEWCELDATDPTRNKYKPVDDRDMEARLARQYVATKFSTQFDSFIRAHITKRGNK